MPIVKNELHKYNMYYYNLRVYIVQVDENNKKETFDYTPYFTGMRIVNDYVNYVFPVTEITFTLDKDTYLRIRDNNVYVVLDGIKKVHTTIVDTTENLTSDSDWLKGEVFTIMDKNVVNFTENDLSEDNPSLDVKYTIFSNRHIEMNKIVINDVFQKARLIDVLCSAFSEVNFPMLIEKPDNVRVYDQIIVPPLNLPRLVRYLQNYYAPYGDGICFSCNYNDGILMNTDISNKTPVINTETTSVFLDCVEDNELNQVYPYDCSYLNDAGYYYVKIQDTSIRYSKKERIREEIYGTKNIVLSRDENLNIQRYDIEDDEYAVKKHQVYFDEINHPFPEDNYYSDNLDIHAIMKFNNLDIDIFKANRKFLVPILGKIDTLKLSRVVFTFKKDDSTGLFNCSGSCLLEEN